MYKWTNHDDDFDWNNPNNWKPFGVPGNGDGVMIPDSDDQGHNLPNDGPAPPGVQLTVLDLGKLGLVGGAGVTVTEGLTWHGGTIDCDLVLAGNGTVTGLDGTMWNPGVLNGHTVTVHGTLTIQGSAGGDSQFFTISTRREPLQPGNHQPGRRGLLGPRWLRHGGQQRHDQRQRHLLDHRRHDIAQPRCNHHHPRWVQPSDRGGCGRGERDVAPVRRDSHRQGRPQRRERGGRQFDIVADTSVANITVGPNGRVAPEFGAGQPSPVLPGILHGHPEPQPGRARSRFVPAGSPISAATLSSR